jgi:hypothetical protein
VNGVIIPMRYGGNYNSYGPQYVRGIIAGNGTPPDKNCWVTYSMNKEDIWIAKIPVPVTDKVSKDVNDVFDKIPEGKELDQWNTYSPLWSPVKIELNAGVKMLSLKDADPYEYAKAERVAPAAKKMMAEIVVTPQQNDHGQLDIEFQDAKGSACIRLSFDTAGNLHAKAGYRDRNLMKYVAGQEYKVRVELDTDRRFYTVNVNGKDLSPGIFFAPVDKVERIVFRTGDVRRFPDADTPTDPMYYSLPNPGDPVKQASFIIRSLITKKL